MIVTPIKVLSSSQNSFTIQLPEKSYVLNQPGQATSMPSRLGWSNAKRLCCQGRINKLQSHSILFRVSSEAFRHSSWFNPDVPASVRLISNEKIIYSEFCKCIRWQDNRLSKEMVFAAESDHIRRFRQKKSAIPAADYAALSAVFEHPFFKKRIQRNVFDISTTGFPLVTNRMMMY